eukprot:gnl/Dysnectes_brevis/2381_a2813_1294.p1 GENE.gnl/Dysnectes_brevis/2381_a2813_1294~~gnl/Dysnectes_brevis/2381_a2813_1294.p1  ORF type:complete len:303 (+),score=59.02 gnl/Dysnectes_brevis/2381_a2813_1294:55-963(+)
MTTLYENDFSRTLMDGTPEAIPVATPPTKTTDGGIPKSKSRKRGRRRRNKNKGSSQQTAETKKESDHSKGSTPQTAPGGPAKGKGQSKQGQPPSRSQAKKHPRRSAPVPEAHLGLIDQPTRCVVKNIPPAVTDDSLISHLSIPPQQVLHAYIDRDMPYPCAYVTFRSHVHMSRFIEADPTSRVAWLFQGVQFGVRGIREPEGQDPPDLRASKPFQDYLEHALDAPTLPAVQEPLPDAASTWGDVFKKKKRRNKKKKKRTKKAPAQKQPPKKTAPPAVISAPRPKSVASPSVPRAIPTIHVPK